MRGQGQFGITIANEDIDWGTAQECVVRDHRGKMLHSHGTGPGDEWAEIPGAEKCAICGHDEWMHYANMSLTMVGCGHAGCECDGFMDLDAFEAWQADEAQYDAAAAAR